MTWLLAAHRSELAKPGDYVVLHSGSEQVAVFNFEGETYATDNLCPHRGSRILPGTHGSRPLVCPYHGLKGKTIIGSQSLTQWLGDWLFVGDGSTKIEDDLGDLGPLLSGISKRISRRHAFDMMPMPCDWTVAVENTLEDFHVPSVHQDTFGKLGLIPEAMERHGRNSVALYQVGDERTVKGLSAIAKHFEDVRPDHYFHIFLYPFTCLSSVGGFSFSLQHYMPSGGYTQMHTRLYAGRMVREAPDYGWFFDEAVGFNRMVFAQDTEACSKVVGQGTFLTEAEDRVKWFREARK
ncbi:MAG: Rieske 2Fe-2S domain-containing protein [Solirubrobacterales bacterium]